jgi:hypothetical protein
MRGTRTQAPSVRSQRQLHESLRADLLLVISANHLSATSEFLALRDSLLLSAGQSYEFVMSGQ